MFNVPRSVTPISAAVTACERSDSLRLTLTRLQACDPPPAEILVHIDGGQPQMQELVAQACPAARVLISTERLGPGGARNRLMHDARHPWVAHFDDDSFPADDRFFAVAHDWILRLPPNVAVLSAVISPHELPPEPASLLQQAVFPGCGHLMNRDWFLRTGGYQPRPVAYNFEEVDVSLQLHTLGATIVRVADLTVVHDHAIPPLAPAPVEAASLANTALFPLLRFPLILLPQTLLSLARRLFTRVLRHPHRWSVLRLALADFTAALPGILTRRQPAPAAAAWSWLALRRNPVPLTLSQSALRSHSIPPHASLRA